MELITDFRKIEREIGVSNAEQTLMCEGITDAPKDLSPILVKHDQGYFFLMLGFEAGNFNAGGVARRLKERADVQVVFYKPYFTWDTIDQDRLMAKDEGEALARVAKEGSRLDVDSDVPVDRFRRFSSRFELNVKPWDEPAEYQVYAIEKEKVISLFGRGIQEARTIATRLQDLAPSISRADREIILKMLNQPRDLRFEKLNALMNEKDFKAILIGSQLNIQELTALPWDTISEDLLVLYDGDRLFLLTPRALDLPQGKKTGFEGRLNKVVNDVIGKGVLGIEEKHMSIGRYNGLQCQKKDAGNILRLWRERHAVFNLPHIIVAAQATKYSMEKALVFLKEKIKNGEKITEKALSVKVVDLFQEFKEKTRLPLELRKSHCSINAGLRTPYPALPSDFTLDGSCRSIKIDTGVQVFQNNLLYAISDMARTLVFSKEAEEMQGYLDQSMLEVAIPACKAGLTGAEIHKAGMTLLLEKIPRIRDLEMIPEGIRFEEVYTRNIGHLMGGKQQPTIMFFTPADKVFRTEEGMMGCVEYQWPIAGHSIGSEDMFLVTNTHGINLVR